MSLYEAGPLILQNAAAWRRTAPEDGRLQHERIQIGLLRKIPDFQQFSDYHRALYSLLLPDAAPIKPFEPSSIEHNEHTALTPEQKSVRRDILMNYGSISYRKTTTHTPDDNERLNVAFIDDPTRLFPMLNALPIVQQLNEIGQTEAKIMPDRLTRGDHSKHLARIVSQTNLRLAMQQPGLYLMRVREDMVRYSQLAGKTFSLEISENTKRIVQQSRENHSLFLNGVERSAMYTATEYGKYIAVAAYLHDAYTPGWGDIFMKTRSMGEGTKGAEYSEDDMLAKHIHELLNQKDEGIVQICETHNLDRELLAIMIRQMANEADACLPGYLMKDKRSNIPEGFGKITELAPGAAYDADQESGTIANAAYLIDTVLPGGFKYKSPDDVPPLGSFEDRMRLIVGILSSGMTKEDVEKRCKDLGIPSSRLYVAAEEIMIGHNLVLKEEKGEVIVASSNAGDVKKALLAINILTMWHYRSSSRAPIEQLVQTMISHGLGSGSITREMFLHRSDYQTAARLREVAPVIVHILNEMAPHAQICTEAEMLSRTLSEGALDHALVLPIQFGKLSVTKPGTMVRVESGNVATAREILMTTRPDKNGQRELKVDSIFHRLTAVENYLKDSLLYMVVWVDPEQEAKILQEINKSHQSKEAMKAACDHWLRDIPTSQYGSFPNRMRQRFANI